MKKTKSNTKIPAKDLCQTPAYALGPLIPLLPPGCVVWESAAGEGYLVRALKDAGFFLYHSDISPDYNWGVADFLNDDFNFPYDVQVTNPPFSQKYKWLARSYEIGRPFALLMPVDVIAAASAQVLFDEYGIEILMLNRRVDFKMPNKGWDGGGADFSVAWFTWGLGIGRQITWMCPIDKKGAR